MKINFHLSWLKSGSQISKAFKMPAAFSLFSEYIQRIERFTPCKVGGPIGADIKKPGSKIWVCHRPGGKTISSEEIASALSLLQNSSIRELHLAIGGPDGFSKEELEELKPDLKWSFGPMTLPHELAAVVASEQIYRAWTILRNMPYHFGHE